MKNGMFGNFERATLASAQTDTRTPSTSASKHRTNIGTKTKCTVQKQHHANALYNFSCCWSDAFSRAVHDPYIYIHYVCWFEVFTTAFSASRTDDGYITDRPQRKL